jgi:hypothetical protein
MTPTRRRSTTPGWGSRERAFPRTRPQVRFGERAFPAMPTAAHCGEAAFPAAGVRPLFGESVFPRTPARYCLERMPRKTNPQLATKYRGLIQGVRKRWSTSGPRQIASKTYSPAQIVDRLQSMLDSIEQTSSAYAVWRGHVAKQRLRESIIRIENGHSPKRTRRLRARAIQNDRSSHPGGEGRDGEEGEGHPDRASHHGQAPKAEDQGQAVMPSAGGRDETILRVNLDRARRPLGAAARRPGCLPCGSRHATHAQRDPSPRRLGRRRTCPPPASSASRRRQSQS